MLYVEVDNTLVSFNSYQLKKLSCDLLRGLVREKTTCVGSQSMSKKDLVYRLLHPHRTAAEVRTEREEAMHKLTTWKPVNKDERGCYVKRKEDLMKG